MHQRLAEELEGLSTPQHLRKPKAFYQKKSNFQLSNALILILYLIRLCFYPRTPTSVIMRFRHTKEKGTIMKTKFKLILSLNSVIIKTKNRQVYFVFLMDMVVLLLLSSCKWTSPLFSKSNWQPNFLKLHLLTLLMRCNQEFLKANTR